MDSRMAASPGRVFGACWSWDTDPCLGHGALCSADVRERKTRLACLVLFIPLPCNPGPVLPCLFVLQLGSHGGSQTRLCGGRKHPPCNVPWLV